VPPDDPPVLLLGDPPIVLLLGDPPIVLLFAPLLFFECE
jgi:hypothetical protein